MSEDSVDFAEIWLGEDIPTKEEAMLDVSKRFNYMLQEYYRAAVMKSKHNDPMVRLYFHSMMGAYFKNYTMIKPGGMTDLRIPIIWVQNSGSGKSQMNKATMDFCKQALGLEVTDSTKFTEAGLIGSFDKSKHEHNVKNNLHPGEETIRLDKNGNSKTIRYEIPVIYGDLKNFDMLFVDEAKILFEKSRHTEDILSVLQPALDFPGRVRKKLAAEIPIEYDCNCTIVASTVEWGDVGKDIMSQGYFPRCVFYARNLSISEQMNIQSDLLRKGNYDDIEYGKHITNFKSMIEEHKYPLTRDRRRIELAKPCFSIIAEKNDQWFKTIQEKLYGQDAKVVQALTARLHVFIFKFAGQMAIINNRRCLDPKYGSEIVFLAGVEEVEYACNVLDHLFQHLIENIALKGDNNDNSLYTTMSSIAITLSKMRITEINKSEFIIKIGRASCRERV